MRATIATVAALLFSTVSATSHFKVWSPWESFAAESTNKNKPLQINFIIMLIGFAAFGLAYLYTVIAIFMDTANRDKETLELLENDEQQIKRLNIDTTTAEF